MSKSIYIAGSSLELELCESWIAKARDAGFAIALNWPAVVRANGSGNPRDASHEQRLLWSKQDLYAARDADIFWLLIPTKPTIGAWVEFGALLYEDDVCKVVSGDWRASIFTSFADRRFDEHGEAFRWIQDRYQ